MLEDDIGTEAFDVDIEMSDTTSDALSYIAAVRVAANSLERGSTNHDCGYIDVPDSRIEFIGFVDTGNLIAYSKVIRIIIQNVSIFLRR